MDKDQARRVSKDEIALLKRLVKRRSNAVLVLRDHFLQLELDKSEKKFISKINSAVLPVLAKLIIPEPVKDVPMGQQGSMYQRMTTLDQMHPEVGIHHVLANDIIVDYLRQQFKALTEEIDEPTKIVLDDLRKPMGCDQGELRVINMLAYNAIITLVGGCLLQITHLTKEPKKETKEEKEKRLAKGNNR